VGGDHDAEDRGREEVKNHEAHLEIQNIECHLRNLVTPEQLEAAGATITPGRPPHIRVMRIIGYLQDALGDAQKVGSGNLDASAERAVSTPQERSVIEKLLLAIKRLPMMYPDDLAQAIDEGEQVLKRE
jgi:hypothetical protein